MTPLERGLCPLAPGRIGPRYLLMIVKGDEKREKSKKLYIEVV